jgi:hypothetical protein
MRFTLDQKTLQEMAVEVGRRFPGSRKDETLRLIVAPGMVFLIASCRRGGAVAIETEEGECTVERKQFTDIIKTFKNEHLLTVSVKDSKLTILRFSMPVNDFLTISKPPEKFDWFGPQPQTSGIPCILKEGT